MDAFISYRRKPSASLALLIQEKLSNKHKIDAYVDTTRTDSTKVQFPDRLMQAIKDAPVFVCLLGDETLDSVWVLKEIEEAYRLQKRCIPVFQESYKPTNNTSAAVNYLLSFDGVHVLDIKNIHMDYSMQDLALLIQPSPSIIDVEKSKSQPRKIFEPLLQGLILGTFLLLLSAYLFFNFIIANLVNNDLNLTQTSEYTAFNLVSPTATIPIVNIDIDFPIMNAVLSGNVAITGSVNHSNFQFYNLEFGPDPNPNNFWTGVQSFVSEEVISSTIAIWETTQIPNGNYQIRLRVVLTDSSEEIIEIHNLWIANDSAEISLNGNPNQIRLRDNVTVIGDAPLNIRTGHNFSFDPLFSAEVNSSFIVLDGPEEGNGYQWWYIQESNGDLRRGWAVSDYLKPDSDQ